MTDAENEDVKLTGVQKICRWFVSQKGLNDKEIILYLRVFVVLVCVLIIIFLVGANDKKDAWDFSSYGFACIAGVMAGAALFSCSGENRALDKIYYSWSVLALFFGLLSYLSSHDTCRYSSTVVLAFFFTVATSVILLPRLLFDPAVGWRSCVVNLLLILVIVSLIAVIFGSAYVAPDLFVKLKCVDQAHR